MKKEWSNPVISSAGIRKTKDDVRCPYRPDVNENAKIANFGPDECCPCEFNAACKKSWKYYGPCPS